MSDGIYPVPPEDPCPDCGSCATTCWDCKDAAIEDLTKENADLRAQVAGLQDAIRHADYWTAKRTEERDAIDQKGIRLMNQAHAIAQQRDQRTATARLLYRNLKKAGIGVLDEEGYELHVSQPWLVEE